MLNSYYGIIKTPLQFKEYSENDRFDFSCYDNYSMTDKLTSEQLKAMKNKINESFIHKTKQKSIE